MTTQPEQLRAQPISQPIPEKLLGWQDCPAVERVAGRMSGGLGVQRHPHTALHRFRQLAGGSQRGGNSQLVRRPHRGTDQSRPGTPGQDAQRGPHRVRIVFDHVVPHALRHQLTDHEVNTAEYLRLATPQQRTAAQRSRRPPIRRPQYQLIAKLEKKKAADSCPQLKARPRR